MASMRYNSTKASLDLLFSNYNRIIRDSLDHTMERMEINDSLFTTNLSIVSMDCN
jgi:hypothetical protein